MWEWLIPSIVEGVIPVLVMICTLRTERRRADEALEESKREAEEQLKQNEEQFRMTLLEAKKSARVEIMPFLTFNQKDVRVSLENNILSFEINISNAGNNAAVNPEVVVSKYQYKDGYVEPHTVFKDETLNIIYILRETFDTAILNKGEHRRIKIGADMKDILKNESLKSRFRSDEFTFRVKQLLAAMKDVHPMESPDDFQAAA